MMMGDSVVNIVTAGCWAEEADAHLSELTHFTVCFLSLRHQHRVTVRADTSVAAAIDPASSSPCSV